MKKRNAIVFVFACVIVSEVVACNGTTHERHIRTLPRLGSNELTSRCYDKFGCFSISPPWTSSSRPINPFPQSPTEIAPGYCLYTRRNREKCSDVSSYDLLKPSKYNGNVSTIVVTHGYLENGRKKWIKRMVQELLLDDDVNVIVLDWVRGSPPPYTQAASNIRLIGTMVAHYMAKLSDAFGPKMENFHFIGHSLGSHLAGYAGSTLRELGYVLGRITGLDPAEPYFEGTEPLIRLDKTDAAFVDVIHTDGGPILSGGLGLMQPLGHIDFYPNGGVQQPGCDKGVLSSIEKEKGSLLYGLRRYIGCNHIRAYEFFTESIQSAKCPFLAVECNSWEDFYSGSCSSCGINGTKCHVLGMRSKQYLIENTSGKNPEAEERSDHVKAFLLTGSEKPFCRFHHRVTIVVSDTEDSTGHGGDRGFFFLTLTGDAGTTQMFKLNQEKVYFEPGVSYTFVTSSSHLGRIVSGILEWQYSRNLFNPFTWRIASQPGIFVNRVELECLETGQRSSLCGHDLMHISGIPVVYLPDKNCRRQDLQSFRNRRADEKRRRKNSGFFSIFN